MISSRREGFRPAWGHWGAPIPIYGLYWGAPNSLYTAFTGGLPIHLLRRLPNPYIYTAFTGGSQFPIYGLYWGAPNSLYTAFTGGAPAISTPQKLSPWPFPNCLGRDIDGKRLCWKRSRTYVISSRRGVFRPAGGHGGAPIPYIRPLHYKLQHLENQNLKIFFSKNLSARLSQFRSVGLKFPKSELHFRLSCLNRFF